MAKEKKEVLSENVEGRKALEAAISSIEKQFGKGSIMLMDKDAPLEEIEAIPTGSLGLDTVLGVGGIPKGRVIEVYGPEASGKTTLTLQLVAEAQKLGHTCAFIDAEHALDMVYAKKIGVNPSELLLSQPDSGEQALEIVETLVRSSSVAVVVVDSVAALVPKAELEGEMGDSHMGLQARLMSQALRKLTAITAKTNTIVIFINQLRSKIGVMFGCLHYDTLINFTDGRSLPIGKVVDEKINGSVYSFNEETNTIEAKPIIDWHDNGNIEKDNDFIHIQTQSIDGKGRFGLTVTTNHKILTEKGWKPAEDLSYDDRVISKYEETINGSYGEFLRGILIGDSSISIRDKNTAALRLQDNSNLDYINWKLDKLSPFLNFTERDIKSGYRYDSEYTYELAKIGHLLYNRDPMYMLHNYSDLSLAVWIMDDGHYDHNDSHNRYSISIKRLKNNENKLRNIVSILNTLGLTCTFSLKDGNINFKTEVTAIIANKIAKYVPECMQYKLPVEYRGQYKNFMLSNTPMLVAESVCIKEIRNASPRQLRNKRKFDITVEENHNYMVGGKYNGIVVHNSPETTTGGNALKFYASVRLDVRKTGIVKDGEDVIGNRVKVKVVKNKVAPPFKECEFDLLYGRGINRTGELLDIAVERNIVEKSGAWYSFCGERLGQGRENSIQFIDSNDNIKNRIEEKLIVKV